MSAAEIVNACLASRSEEAWASFVRQFQPLIASSVSRVLRRYGSSNASVVDDLVQETYLRLCKDNWRSLREFRARHDDAIYGFLKVVATSVALDYFRARSAIKRGIEVDCEASKLELTTPSHGIEHLALLKELDRRLANSESERDRTIFWLYYRQGYTAKDIALIPNIGLTQKGVESCIHRLTQALRADVNTLRKGFPPQSALGVFK